MTGNRLNINTKEIESLINNPRGAIEGNINGHHYRAWIAIPDYADKIKNHYPEHISVSLDSICQTTAVPFNFKHFGVICEFEKQIEIQLHDRELNLDDNVRKLVDIFGPLLLKKVYFDSYCRQLGHRNRFPHLHFHRDRDFASPSTYSLFSRDPFDPEQIEPRTSSTLFISNITAYLQCLREGRHDQVREGGVTSHCKLFKKNHDEDIEKLMDRIILQSTWNEPRGTGEISVLDNRTVLHASYYQNQATKAYRIGVRYLT